MATITELNGSAADRSARRPKSAADLAAPPLPIPGQEIVDVPAVSSSLQSERERDLEAEIQTLRTRLRQQELLLEERSAALEAAEADRTAIAFLQNQLLGKEAVLREKDSAIFDLEQRLSAQVQSLELQLKTRDEILTRREAELDSLRKILDVETAETYRRQEARNRSSAEFSRLIEERRTANLALAKIEMEEWHLIGRRNAWKRALRVVQRLFDKPWRDTADETLKEQMP